MTEQLSTNHFAVLGIYFMCKLTLLIYLTHFKEVDGDFSFNLKTKIRNSSEEWFQASSLQLKGCPELGKCS